MFDVLYVLIVLGAVVTGLSVMIHLRGEHEPPTDCRPCRRINKLTRWIPKGAATRE
ncbi:hypothetical protein [Streptomyces lomondensis]|uniref:Uncharacterized protein n=1 Tax=Streptomyces lomondensis TaxID=68229 RepID=A0ABQ2XTS3_9ACTN|nr:hypothetical protein [Streptomyces lomondensis]MCF0082712.1 hypothetical protein [Streptomyces lomondensis]GGX32240.1 hypothetical protein GCM10010383_73180 [Streptomyces lomondensis]